MVRSAAKPRVSDHAGRPSSGRPRPSRRSLRSLLRVRAERGPAEYDKHCRARYKAPHNGRRRMAATAGSNVAAHIAYDDLREWLAAAERLGEVRHLKGATWQEDIGLVAEAILRAENGPCVVF